MNGFDEKKELRPGRDEIRIKPWGQLPEPKDPIGKILIFLIAMSRCRINTLPCE
jgi:hypothetical protein